MQLLSSTSLTPSGTVGLVSVSVFSSTATPSYIALTVSLVPGQPFPGIAPSAAEVTRTGADITRQFSSLRLQPTYRVRKNRSAVSCFNTTTPLSNLRKENGKLLGKMKQMEDRVAEIDEARRAQGIEIHALTNQYDTLQAEQVKLKKAVESRDKKIEFLKSELAKLTGN
ncbi:hypothetical protein ACEPPN_004817 [Leptodophora sp. 'Broadleaf-Isolate-01']